MPYIVKKKNKKRARKGRQIHTKIGNNGKNIKIE